MLLLLLLLMLLMLLMLLCNHPCFIRATER
jgi:hypothetical protein